MALISRSFDETRPSLDAAPDPVFDKLMQDVEVLQGRIAVREERFEFWAKRLRTNYPRAEHKLLYRQIFAAACILAPHRAPAALQLFALACLGLHPVVAWRAARTDRVFLSQEAQQLRVHTEVVARSGVTAALRPNRAVGVSMTAGRRRS